MVDIKNKKRAKKKMRLLFVVLSLTALCPRSTSGGVVIRRVAGSSGSMVEVAVTIVESGAAVGVAVGVSTRGVSGVGVSRRVGAGTSDSGILAHFVVLCFLIKSSLEKRKILCFFFLNQSGSKNAIFQFLIKIFDKKFFSI